MYTTIKPGANKLNKWLNTRYVADRLLSKSDLSAPSFFGGPLRSLVEAVRILFCGLKRRSCQPPCSAEEVTKGQLQRQPRATTFELGAGARCGGHLARGSTAAAMAS